MIPLTDCLSLCLSDCLSLCLSVCLSVSLSRCLSLCLSVSLSLCLSVSLSRCLSLCLSVCLTMLPQQVLVALAAAASITSAVGSAEVGARTIDPWCVRISDCAQSNLHTNLKSGPGVWCWACTFAGRCRHEPSSCLLRAKSWMRSSSFRAVSTPGLMGSSRLAPVLLGAIPTKQRSNSWSAC